MDASSQHRRRLLDRDRSNDEMTLLLPCNSSSVGISMRHYAYICAADGEPHILVPDAGEWVYDITIDPPTFHGAEAASSGCVDRADWSSLEGGLRCSSYGIEATQSSEELEEVCMAIGSFDIPPSAGNPPVQYDMPAYLACPVSCRNCWRCNPPNASATPPPGCPSGGGECILAGAAGMASGSLIDSGSPQYPSSQDAEELIAALQAGGYSCTRGEGGGSSSGNLLVVPPGGGVFVKELSVVMRTSTPGASQVIIPIHLVPIHLALAPFPLSLIACTWWMVDRSITNPDASNQWLLNFF